tara:strand:- start:180 stop:353 length:174 start_codon:yes stop_codon:yes gene_type:complete
MDFLPDAFVSFLFIKMDLPTVDVASTMLPVLGLRTRCGGMSLHVLEEKNVRFDDSLI